jgi:hypothetical protein
MSKEEEAKIVKSLLNATKELNGEFQIGWDKEIREGERLMKQLDPTYIILWK